MKKIVKWFSESNRWKHLLGGIIVGLFAGNLYAAGYSALVAGACLEFKDRAYGGKWDWIDLLLTFLGGVFGGLPAFFL